jgi:radical SAM superfamily enzyme YgiQ (UPF0313 family)
MIQRRKRLVLFMPHRANPAAGVRVYADLLPLELLQIAGLPDREGYEVCLIDANVQDDWEKRVLEACDGALLFASSCILGYQVTHGAEVARMVRARFPDLPIIWGGWFPSVAPELYLGEGIADAVGLGQGEFTFRDVVAAIDSGEPLDDVAGLALWRDGQMVKTLPRPVVGFDDIPDVPWHLLDYEDYVRAQNEPGEAKIRHKLPDPYDWKPGTPYRGFSFFSSFGCPEPCTFCCSPLVTNRRWKAIGGKLLAERILECHDRFKFNNLRFQDANFGVAEKRSNEWCRALLDHYDGDVPWWWNGTYEIETIARYKEESCDLLRDSKCHLLVIGAEAGSKEQQERIKKKIDLEHNLEFALRRIYDRGIQTGTTWIIGYPGEDAASMRSTIQMAARMKHSFPGSASDIFPFRPIPGSEDFDSAVKLGYRAPDTLEGWGACLEYKQDSDTQALPEDVVRTWRRYGATSTFYDGIADVGSKSVRSALKSISGWRLKTGNYGFPLEQKLFDLWVRMAGRSEKDAIEHDRTAGVTPHPEQV